MRSRRSHFSIKAVKIELTCELFSRLKNKCSYKSGSRRDAHIFRRSSYCIGPVCKPEKMRKIKQNSILPLLQTTVRKVFVFCFFWSRPLAGSYRIRFRGWSATASCRAHGWSRTRGASQTERRDSLSVKSEELRSSTFPLNELCLTSLLGALLPHPPPLPPASPLFVSTAWECQLPLVEDAAYTVLIISPFLSPDPLSHSLSLTHSRICKKHRQS